MEINLKEIFTYNKLNQFWLVVFVIGIPTSKILLSISTIFLLMLFLIKFCSNVNQIVFDRKNIILLSLLGLQLISLFWTENISDGLKEIKSKFPLYFFPILLSSYKISIDSKFGQNILKLFVATVFTVSIINMFSFDHFDVTLDKRSLSGIINHIRFGIIIVFSIGILIYFLSKHDAPILWEMIYYVLIAWFLFYTFYSEVFSGLVCLIILIFTTVFDFLVKKKLFILSSNRIIGLVLSIFIVFVTLIYFLLKPDEEINKNQTLQYYTEQGNLYMHKLHVPNLENGHRVYYYISRNELKDAWNKVSNIDFDDLDRKGNMIEGTVIRYMTSLGLRKDAKGVSMLSQSDIVNIENGIPSILNTRSSFKSRLNDLKYEINYSDNPNGSTILQRFEYWKTGWLIFKESPFLGVSYGDLEKSFARKYEEENSKLLPENRFTSHNQYLTIAVSLGVVGVLLFLAMNYLFLKESLIDKSYLGILFISIVLVSYLVEDTLETQTGLAFVSYFFAILQRKNN